MSGRSSKAVTLEMGDGVTPTEGFTKVANLTKIKAPEFGVGTIDVTDMDSTAEEHIGDGIQQHGEVTIEGHHFAESATQNETAGLLKAARDGTVRNFRVNIPTNATAKRFAFGAIVKFMPSDSGAKDPLKFTATLKVATPIVIT